MPTWNDPIYPKLTYEMLPSENLQKGNEVEPILQIGKKVSHMAIRL